GQSVRGPRRAPAGRILAERLEPSEPARRAERTGGSMVSLRGRRTSGSTSADRGGGRCVAASGPRRHPAGRLRGAVHRVGPATKDGSRTGDETWVRARDGLRRRANPLGTDVVSSG